MPLVSILGTARAT